MSNFKSIQKAGMSILAIINGGYQLYELFKGRASANSLTCAAEEAKPQEDTTTTTEEVA